jgi:hypothetical protein
MRTDFNDCNPCARRGPGAGRPLESVRKAEAAYHEAMCRYGHNSAQASVARWHLQALRQRRLAHREDRRARPVP